jgi:hypothetical protein
MALLVVCPVLIAQPATEPAGGIHAGIAADAIIRLPDGREVNLADLHREGGATIAMVRHGPEGRVIHATEDGRKIDIIENDDEIVVTIKEADAEPVEYRAPNAEELEANHPEAFEVYEKFAADVMIPGLHVGPHGGGGRFDARQMQLRMQRPMFGSVAALGIRATPVSDDFVRVQLGEGVIVMDVTDRSRAEKLGLEQYDLIKSINGSEVASLEELKEKIAADQKLEIELIREGKPMKLAEK